MQPKLQKVASFDIPEDVKQVNNNKSPPSESKLRFVVSNFTHNNQFVYKPPPSANFVNPRKRLLNLSQPLDQDSDESEPIPDRPILEDLKVEEIPKNVPIFNGRSSSREPSWPMSEAKENAPAKPKETVLLTPANLSVVTTRTIRPVRMRELVRRKSCHCSDCGGLSRLEKKTLDLKPDLKNQKKLDISPDIIATIQTPVSNPRSTSKTSKKTSDARPRGSTVSALLQAKRQDYHQSATLDFDTRPRTKTTGTGGAQSGLEPIKAENFEKFLEKGIEPSTGKTIAEVQESEKLDSLLDKLSDAGENVPKTINAKPSKFKTANFQGKKIQLKNLMPKKVPQSSRIESKVSVYNFNGRVSAGGKNASTERIEKKVENLSETKVEKNAKIVALHNLLSKKRSEGQVHIPSLESLPGTGCVDLYLKKVNRKDSTSSLPYKRSSSVSKLSDGSIIVQRGVNNATKCYIGLKSRIEELNSIAGSGSWLERVRMENKSNREGRFTEREGYSLRDRRGYFNMVRGDNTCENILRSVRDSLEREREVEIIEIHQGKENEKQEERIGKLKSFVPMFLMNNRMRRSKSKPIL